jgi:glycosyltransferase involved in cell wall biosynthesis
MEGSEETKAATQPLVSVVIPTHRRETRLSFALDALASQTIGLDRFEVVAVRSPEGGPRTDPPAGLRVRFLDSPEANISVQRNIGWRATAAPLVAFTDDDCRPAPDWLERLLEGFRTTDGAGAGDRFIYGRTEPDPDEGHLNYGIARTIHVIGPDQWFRTCNIAYPRELLERLGGFDEELAFHCEDTDLGLRAQADGAEGLFCDEAIVWHAVHVRSFGQAVRDAMRLSGEPDLLARWPQQRDELYLRTFVSEEHAKVLLALGGVLLWRRSRVLAALAAYPYVMGRVAKRLRNPNPLSPIGAFRLAADIAVEGTLDAVEVAARVRSSAASRELVL